MALEFQQPSRPGEGTYPVVMKDGRRLGRIYRPPDGLYRFHLGDAETAGPEFSDHDLDRLKKKIIAKHGP